MRASLSRALHTSRVSLAFRQGANSSGSSSGSAKDRATTPRKSNGEFRWFEKAAPYSNFHKRAPVVSSEVEIIEPTADSLPHIEPAQLVSWPNTTEAFLHHIGSFKPAQQNELFNSYVTLVRSETKKLWTDLLSLGKSSLITGNGGIGKTSLLAQAHAAAKTNGWGVLHISQVEKLLDGSSFTVFEEKTNLWNQPMFISRLWKKTLKANRALLGNKAKNANTPTTLTDLVKVFEGHKLLVTADNINALNHHPHAVSTNYDNERLYHKDLEVVNTLLQWMAKAPSNACVVAATSGNFKPIDWEGYPYAPLTDFDPELVSTLSKASRLDVGRLTGEETRSFVNFLRAAKVTERSWEELYQFGNGNPRAIITAATNFAY